MTCWSLKQFTMYIIVSCFASCLFDIKFVTSFKRYSICLLIITSLAAEINRIKEGHRQMNSVYLIAEFLKHLQYNQDTREVIVITLQTTITARFVWKTLLLISNNQQNLRRDFLLLQKESLFHLNLLHSCYHHSLTIL